MPPLHLKHRPPSFAQMVGNASTIAAINSILGRQEGLPHAWLFVGPPGCGKTTLARITGQELGAGQADITEYNIADVRGIDTAREIVSRLNFRPISGKVRVIIMDEIQAATRDFQQALLKPLEDTPEHVHFMLCTTDPDKLLAAVRSRCTTFTVESLGDNYILRLLANVCKAEGVTIADEVLKQITLDCLGSPRTALVILDKIIDMDPKDQLKAAQQSASEASASIDLCRALVKGANWREVASIIDRLKDSEPESTRRAVLGYFSSVILKSGDMRCRKVMEAFKENYFNTGRAGLIMSCHDCCQK